MTYADKVLTLNGGKIDHEGTFVQLVRAGIVKETAASAPLVSNDTNSNPPASKIEDKSLQVAEANEVSDLTRKTGDRAVYQYYFRSIGWRKTLTFVGFTVLHIFAATFSRTLPRPSPTPPLLTLHQKFG